MANLTSLIVKIKTSSSADSGTNDEVYFSIGTREWQLDNTTRNDFEPGRTDTFVLQNLSGLRTEHIRRIRLRKTGTDGWKPEWIKVYVNQPTATGTPFYQGNINFFLDGGGGAEQKAGLHWQASDFPKRWPFDFPSVSKVDPVVFALWVQITTGTRTGAGTDDEVYFSIGTREWKLDNTFLNDFESGQSDFFMLTNLTGLKMSDIQKIGVRKTGSDVWFPEHIRVFVNGAFFFEDDIKMWLNGGGGISRNNRGMYWTSRNFPQPAPLPVEDRVTALKVEIETANVTWGNTNDQVYFSIGTREWLLDNPNRNDFELGNTDTFNLGHLDGMGGLRLSDFRKIALRKSGTDGWQPKKIKVFVNNETTPLYEGDINVMLDGGGGGAENTNGLNWEASDFVWEVPVHCHYVIGQNDATIGPGRSKQACAELIMNLNTETYRQRTGSACGYWTQGRVRYRVVGFTDAPVPDADALIRPDSDSADFTTMKNVANQFNIANRLNIYFVKNTESGSNWHVSGPPQSVWVKDTRRSETLNTTPNHKQVAISLSHEIGHYFGLPHMCDDVNANPCGGTAPRKCCSGENKFLMFGDGTNAVSQLLSRNEANTAHNNARTLAENA